MLASWFSDHVWFNKASIPNISFLGSLEKAQIYLTGTELAKTFKKD